VPEIEDISSPLAALDDGDRRVSGTIKVTMT
jgi:hypothetical protein